MNTVILPVLCKSGRPSVDRPFMVVMSQGAGDG